VSGWLLTAGAEIVVEEFLDGEEASFFALIDGETCVALASAQVRSFSPKQAAQV
jgi:phosphoribosylamine--glycine ligase